MKYIFLDTIWDLVEGTGDELTQRALRFMGWESYTTSADGADAEWHSLLMSGDDMPWDPSEYIGGGGTFGGLMVAYAILCHEYPMKKWSIHRGRYDNDDPVYVLIGTTPSRNGSKVTIAVVDTQDHWNECDMTIQSEPIGFPCDYDGFNEVVSMDRIYTFGEKGEPLPIGHADEDDDWRKSVIEFLGEKGIGGDIEGILGEAEEPEAGYRKITVGMGVGASAVIDQIILKRKAWRMWKRVMESHPTLKNSCSSAL